jgi:hypothetical protein
MPHVGDAARGILPDGVIATVSRVPGVRSVELVGSRADGRATSLSDWDFQVETDAFPAVQRSLPRAVLRLRPVVAQWDRLSRTWCYMFILRGPHKVDLIFAEPHPVLPPWTVGPSTLAGIDEHFWDWMLWLRSKQAAGKASLVQSELDKLHAHLLGAMGVADEPRTIEEALDAYRRARSEREGLFGMSVSRLPQQAIEPAITSA